MLDEIVILALAIMFYKLISKERRAMANKKGPKNGSMNGEEELFSSLLTLGFLFETFHIINTDINTDIDNDIDNNNNNNNN